MSGALRPSWIRLWAGAALAVLGLGVFGFLLPGASRKLEQRRRAGTEARADLDRAERNLAELQAENQRIKDNRSALERLLRDLPAATVADLSWRLSQTLFEQSSRHGVRLLAVKYGGPTREGSHGLGLESVDVEFTATGLFQELKAFMLALERGRLPFAVVTAKLDESPEGGRLTIGLRAFRQAPEGAAP